MGVYVALFNRASANGRVNLLDVTLRGGILSDWVEFEYIELRFDSPLATTTALFHHSTVRRGEFHLISSNCFVELRDATIGYIEINAGEKSNPFDNLYIDSTNFSGFEFSDYREELRDINWKIDGAYVEQEYMPPEKREVTYSKAKAGAAGLGDRLAESKFSILERRYRRRKYLESVRDLDSPRSAAVNVYRLVTNVVYDALSKYGESPQRVLLWALLSVIAFSFIYNQLISWPTANSIAFSAPLLDYTYNVESFIISVQSFTSFLVGQPNEELGVLVTLAASVESFIGAFSDNLLCRHSSYEN